MLLRGGAATPAGRAGGWARLERAGAADDGLRANILRKDGWYKEMRAGSVLLLVPLSEFVLRPGLQENHAGLQELDADIPPD